MPIKIKQKILEELFKKYYLDEQEIFSKYYLSKDDINELIANGMEIGSHGYHHWRLSIMNDKEQITEIFKSKKILENMFNIKIRGFSYPMGNYNEKTIQFVKNADYKFAITTIFKINKGISPAKLYEIYRIDNKSFFEEINLLK